MRIGFTTIYSYRPHVEHLFFLAQLARKDGHEPFFLTCDSGLSSCYTREFRPHSSTLVECLKCTLGGLRSYPGGPYSSIRQLLDHAISVPDAAWQWGESSVCSLLRTEQPADKDTPAFSALRERLGQATGEGFRAACSWIERCHLDAVVLFNGRRDATRGVLEAARFMGIPFLSVERTWFGDGLQLIPEDNCLGLSEVDRLNREFRSHPLSAAQASRTARLLASRFLRRNSLEWRAYNVNAIATRWPAHEAGAKLLFLPSSRYEFDGHPDGENGWSSPTAAFDSLLSALRVTGDSCVLRCHPSWGEKVGQADGQFSESMYTAWARDRGVHCIGSGDRASTHELMRQADAVVVNGGSAGFEAALLGKPVIGLSPSHYNEGGFQIRYYAPDDRGNLDALGRQDPMDVARMALRCAHTLNFRFYQYVDEVRALTTTRYVYDKNANSRKFVVALTSGHLLADDSTLADAEEGEDGVLNLIRSEQWETLFAHREDDMRGGPMESLKRRLWLRPIEVIRDTRPRGDF
jgi:hypothetical protein